MQTNAPPSPVAGSGPTHVVTDVIARRDFVHLAEVLDPHVQVRALTPDGYREASGADEAVALFAEWFGRGGEQVVVLDEPFSIGNRKGLRFRLRRRLAADTDVATWYLLEQDWFADVGPLGIERLDLVCSGNLRERAIEDEPSGVHEFDAGDLGCGDGLPQEFMRRIRSIPVGHVLRVITTDASAREDLPALARLNGHRVAPPQDLGDRRTLFIIERRV